MRSIVSKPPFFYMAKEYKFKAEELESQIAKLKEKITIMQPLQCAYNFISFFNCHSFASLSLHTSLNSAPQ